MGQWTATWVGTYSYKVRVHTGTCNWCVQEATATVYTCMQMQTMHIACITADSHQCHEFRSMCMAT